MEEHGWKVILRTTLLSNLSLVKVRVPVQGLEDRANELKGDKAG